MNEHRQAILARLRLHPHLASRVVDGPASGQSPPYVVVYLHIPGEERTKLEGPTDQATITIITHSVGANPDAAGIVARNVRQQLLDHRLDVAGWRCQRIRHEVGRSPDWDDTTGTRVMDAVDEWDYLAEPVQP